MKQIDFKLNEYLKDLELLVNIDSGSRIPGGTNAVASFFQERYEALGLSVKEHSFSDTLGPCLEIRNCPDQENIDVLFLGHMDTVFPDGEARKRPFTQKDGLAYGPGVADMKGGLVSIYYLMKQLVEDQLGLSFCIALNSDEEISSVSSKEWIQTLARKSSFAIVMEPGRKNGEYVSERKGLARYTVTVDGVAAHAGVAPENGASAIHQLAHLITSLAALNNYEIGTSVNVGTICGGSSANVVCDHAECQVDTRFDQIEEHRTIENEMKALSTSPCDSRIRISYKREGFRPPMGKSEATQQMMTLMEKIGTDMDMEVKWVKTGGGSDGNFAAFENCPTIDGAGPTGDKVHSEAEYLQIDSIEPRIQILYQLITCISQQKEG